MALALGTATLPYLLNTCHWQNPALDAERSYKSYECSLHSRSLRYESTQNWSVKMRVTMHLLSPSAAQKVQKAMLISLPLKDRTHLQLQSWKAPSVIPCNNPLPDLQKKQYPEKGIGCPMQLGRGSMGRRTPGCWSP